MIWEDPSDWSSWSDVSPLLIGCTCSDQRALIWPWQRGRWIVQHQRNWHAAPLPQWRLDQENNW